MAAVLAYAGVKGYQRYQSKRAQKSELGPDVTVSNGKNKRKTLAKLDIPTVASAHNCLKDNKNDSTVASRSEQRPSPLLNLPPESATESPPIMLGLTSCESPSMPKDREDPFNDSQHYVPSISIHEMSENCGGSILALSQGAGTETTSIVPPVDERQLLTPPIDTKLDMTYSSDESEADFEEDDGKEPR